jgi:hypothetical protein
MSFVVLLLLLLGFVGDETTVRTFNYLGITVRKKILLLAPPMSRLS